VKNFSVIAKPLSNLTRKRIPFVWTQVEENAYLEIKNTLLNAPILAYPDFDKNFIITTDASNIGCGAMISQMHGPIERAISFASKSFTKGEANKSTIEKELTAIHWAIKYFRPYIYGRKFKVKSDHRPLCYLYSLKDPSSKLTRMRLDLEEYDFTIEYFKGSDNVVADALSRMSFDDIKNIENTNKILKVTTRAQAREKVDNNLINTNVNINNTNNSNNVNIDNPRVVNFNKTPSKGMPQLITKNFNNNISFEIFYKKKILMKLKFSIHDKMAHIIRNVMLEIEKLNINHVKLYMNDKIFQNISLTAFRVQQIAF
jgi:hypothetical protein